MSRSEKFHALLSTARLPNVPSVVSNVWLGIALGAYQWGWDHDRELFTKGGVLALSGIFLYIGGNFLNDWHDREWDATHRAERALPRGLFKPLNYLLHAVRFLGLGAVCAAFGGVSCLLTALAIIVLIVVYTRWHKRATWPVIPMGLCRALLPVMGFLAIHPRLVASEPSGPTISLHGTVHALAATPVDPAKAALLLIALHALGLFGWIAGLSLNAKYESQGNPPPLAKGLAKALLVLPFVVISGLWLRWYPVPALIGMVPLALWLTLSLRGKRSIGQRVAMLLAGIPLVEWLASMPLAIALARDGESLLTTPVLGVTLLLPAFAFLLGRRLQQTIAAT